MATRWGIAGAGKISVDFCLALKTLPETEHCIKAVGARSLERAKEFAAKFQIEVACGSYEDLFLRDDVDVIYIGTINTTHKELSICAMKSGKHVLCEKPAGMNSSELDEIFSVAKQERKLFMEAVWTRFFPAHLETFEALKNGIIGDIMAVQVTFGISVLGSIDRVTNPGLGGSVLMDIGIYLMHFVDMVFGGDEPIKRSTIGFLADSGVDLCSSTTFLFRGKKIAQAMCSGIADLPNEGIIIGTKGRIIFRAPFWCPTLVTINDVDKSYSLPETLFPTNFANSAGLRYEAEHVRKLIIEGKIESDVMTHSTSKRIMRYLEQSRQEVNN